MKISAIVSIIAALACHSVSASEILVGNFGHEFTRKNGDVVWKIQPKGNAYELHALGDNSKATIKPMSRKAINSFWEKMLWPASTTLGVSCLANREDIFCYVPRDQQEKIDWISGNKSGFFYYSTMGGIMEINKIDTQLAHEIKK
jgi:hypothetical protein